MPDAELIATSIPRERHTLLVVDDNPATRYTTARVLRAAGFPTVEAVSGAEALQMSTDGVSAVVLDVHLPDLDGFEICRRIRSNPRTMNLPVVHLSATYVTDRDKVAGLDAGADGYLIHPVEPTVLVATLQALIRARTAEDDLRRSQDWLQAIHDHAPGAIVLFDAQGRFADVNPALERLLGRSRADLVDRPVVDFVPPEWREFALERLSPDDGSAGWQGAMPLLHADGHWVHLDWTIAEHPEPGHRIGIAQDASERIQLAKRRHELLQQEQAARVAAEQHSRTKDDFIAVLSHELRTPLNAIVGWVEIMRRRDATPEVLKGLDVIDRNVKTQARIISDILDVARINSGKLQLQREWTRPDELIQTSLASLQAALATRELRVEAEVGGAREPVWLDPARFQQIFWNLMTNAIKFSPVGGAIHITLTRHGPLLELRVQDWGMGIRPDFIGRLFDRFTQSDAPGNRSHGGLGLGLSIVRHLAQLHGGGATAQSPGEGKGATLTVTLDVGTQAREQPAASAATRAPLAGLSVLLVEDDADALDALTQLLAGNGAAVSATRSVDEAIHALRDIEFDLLISDIGLPERDGIELIRAVRAREAAQGTRRLPAIALTAFSRDEDRIRTLAEGFDHHASKPLDPPALLGAIEALTEAGRGDHVK